MATTMTTDTTTRCRSPRAVARAIGLPIRLVPHDLRARPWRPAYVVSVPDGADAAATLAAVAARLPRHWSARVERAWAVATIPTPAPAYHIVVESAR